MKKNLIINFFTLAVTALLLVFVVMAWYVTNSNVTADGIFGSTSSDSFALELERGEYDENTGWSWESTKSLSITNMQPGSTFFFRFKINASKAGKFKTVFNDVESKIDPSTVVEKETISDDDYVFLNGYKYYKMDNTNKVPIKVKDGNNIVTKYLYTYEEEQVTNPETEEEETVGTFSLADFKVEDMFVFYDYGIGDEVFYSDNDVTNDSIDSYVIVNKDSSFQQTYNNSLVSDTYYVKTGEDTYELSSGLFNNDTTYYTKENNVYTESEGLSQETYNSKLKSTMFYIKSGSVYSLSTNIYNSSLTYYSKSSTSRTVPLVGATTQYEMSSSGVKYAYFALEFNDELSLVNYLHPGFEYDPENPNLGFSIDSNLYQAQILSIKKIGLEEVR